VKEALGLAHPMSDGCGIIASFEVVVTARNTATDWSTVAFAFVDLFVGLAACPSGSSSILPAQRTIKKLD